MSVKNIAKDSDHNGRIRRKYTSRHKWGVHYDKSPSWWAKLFMTRLILPILWATFQIDHFELFGLKKPFLALTGRASGEREFVTPFLYRHMRHPIQTGVLLGMWLQGYMTVGQLLLTLGMALYGFIGLYFEEKDMVAEFGNRYKTYMQQVPRLFPRPGKQVRKG